MAHSVHDLVEDLHTFQHVVWHVFFPIQLPDGDDHSSRLDHSLARAVASVAHLYEDYIDKPNLPQWNSVTKMLDSLAAAVQFESLDQSQAKSQFSSMSVGDVRTFFIRAQNAAVIFRKQRGVILCESFEVSPKAEEVVGAKGKLIRSYPGPAIEVPHAVFEDEGFLSELVNFLSHMNEDVLDASPTSQKAHSTVLETRNTTHPRYITELLTGILRGVGRPADISRISKRVGDDVVWNHSEIPWRRSSLWLVIRVALQTSFGWSTLEHNTYKTFMTFFMCCLAKENMCSDLPNDLLRCMSTKISRRLRKLGSSAPDWLSSTVLQTCASLHSTLGKRWKEVQVPQYASSVSLPSQFDLNRDTQLSLQRSGDYLRNVLSNCTTILHDTTFQPKHHSRGSLEDFLSNNGSFFKDAFDAEPHIALYDVEWAVEHGIDAWVDRITDSAGVSCKKLVILAERYSSAAQKTYANNPELLSIMLLTLYELWVAVDKITIKDIPILADYSAEVPISLLEALLLYRANNLHRLRLVHEYLSSRYSRSLKWSVFSPTITADSFSVRYYKGSSHLQSLKDRIEKAAELQAERKVAELQTANSRHAAIQSKASLINHIHAVGSKARNCEKCGYEKELQKKIHVHEWPLPAARLHAEATVFELDCPISFNMWRTITFHLLVDICSPPTQPQKPYIQLGKYAGLAQYLVQHPTSRFTLASDAKPFVVTHYKRTSIPATKERVCVNSGLSLYGFDTRARVPSSKALGHTDISGYCTYQVHSGPYRNLQKYVDGTSHTSNEVMANQADCHRDLLIHEYIAFGHLRSGGLLQWLNILRELRGRSLSFHRPEVHILFAQAVSQVGPFAQVQWTWHQEIEKPSFCFAILGELASLLQDVEANWLEGVTMDTISLLLRRILASCPDPAVTSELLKLLRTVRCKVFAWIQELLAKLSAAPDDEELRGLLRDNAIICRSTFDVGPSAIQKVLHSAEDIEMLISTAILIHHHTPSNASGLSPYSQLLLDRHRRLSLVLENATSRIIQADCSDQGINRAIRRVWPYYRPGSKWTQLQCPNSRWFECTTASTAEQCSQVLHFNILNGSFLVNGKSLGRLPSDILQHPLYNFIFGKKVLEVVPGDLPGMDYSTRGRISNYQVYFSLRNKSDLVIRAISDSETIELIPQRILEGDLPAVLIEGHAHWLNLSTSLLEIRPLQTLWESSVENWNLECTSGEYRMRKGKELLLDIQSQSWAMVSRLLKPLDIPKNLVVSVTPIQPCEPSSSLQLSASLPRYGLSFYVDEDGDFQSHNLRGMVYDEDQQFGTLYGLLNRLVLRPKFRDDVDAEEVTQRCVLIPEGKVSFKTVCHHVCVEIDTHDPAFHRVPYQTYSIDTDLGCLTGNVSLTSKLYCAYLHALTSGCGIDPLTGRSGTEEALSLLRSASCWSTTRLSSRDAELLKLIASLCPSRTWYPQMLKCMQKVVWLDLPASSQHHELYVISRAIKDHYENIQLFHEGHTDSFLGFPSPDNHLLERSARRAAYLFPSEFSGMPSGPNGDTRSSARDLVEADSGEHRACTAAAVVYRRATGSGIAANFLTRLMESWQGPVSLDAAFSLRYDRSWLAPDLPLTWLRAYNLLRRGDEGKWYCMLFSLPAMAYASPELADLVPAFVAFARDWEFIYQNPPLHKTYDLSKGYHPSLEILRTYVARCARPFESSPESTTPAEHGTKKKKLLKTQREAYRRRVSVDSDAAANQLLKTWWSEAPPRCTLGTNLYDVTELTSEVQIYFSECAHNLEFKAHVAVVQKILNDVYSRLPAFATDKYSFHPSQHTHSRTPWSFEVDQLFTRRAPSLLAYSSLLRLGRASKSKVENTTVPGLAPLRQLITTIDANTSNPFHQRYVSALRTSADCLRSEVSFTAERATMLDTSEALMHHYIRCRSGYIEALHRLKRRLGPRSESERALELSGLWPRLSALALFRFLASNSPVVLPDHWKSSIIQFTLLALELQRARRLLQYYLDDLREEFHRELSNPGCEGWEAEAHPDWLLVQLQGNFLIRRVQAEVANEMITPRSGDNTAMQLNMGEGKSSVIVPIVAADLADGDQLVRVIVPKALTAQMFHLLVDRLGGILNRRICFIPFSRSLKIDDQKATALREILSKCMKERGILVVQPEHILSLKLVSVEKQLTKSKDRKLAGLCVDLQRWLHSRSRDILDESDEILHVRYQLVYSIGHQQHMEGFPERWTTTEQVLGLVDKHASSLLDLFPFGVEYERGLPGSFPHLRILHEDACATMLSWIVQDVIGGVLPNFSFGQLSSGLRNAIQSFISCADVSLRIIQAVKEYFHQTPLWGGLLLLRGLLANGILSFAFRERRWRVDYGLAPARSMLAVPYRAKDIPAQRAEFGHPEVAIVLTCLSYYYGGLTEEQLKVCFEILYKQDDPSLDYSLWVRDCPALPDALRILKGVNVKSSEQWNEFLFPFFSRNKATIDFYLSSVVFPKEAKEFPSKLSCSGWDLSEKKERVLTGFSGTNDARYLLPLHITQHDPEHQRATNAKVLSYLLQPENKYYMCMTHENGERRTTRGFLKILVSQKPEIRVLLDVGAQMLELQNNELAKEWLDINQSASAAIYFNEDDELTVLTRDGNTQLFLSSPFAQQLDQCVVYLDDAHTRGTDIKFPRGFRAAVTLGPKVTKDRLVQGCMRMRKLVHGHSVMFFAPLEVDRRIRSLSGKEAPSDVIDTMDILHWAIRETCDDIQQRVPHWAQQGVDHTSRYAVWTSFCKGTMSSEALSDKWLQPEAKSLEDLYGPQVALNPKLLGVPEIRQRCIELGALSIRDVSMDEEQEREIVHEAERERQVEPPTRASPAMHVVQPDVISFVDTGFIPKNTKAFRPVFQTLGATSATTQEAQVWSSLVLATTDFVKTVESTKTLDDYLRPVQWVVFGKWSKNLRVTVLVILSPFEVNCLLPRITSSGNVHLHLYTPRVTKSMEPCDDLTLYSLPEVPSNWTPPIPLMDQLNVFAGQLYFKDYEAYIRLCRFLCVYGGELQSDEGIEVGCDGFIPPNNRPKCLQTISSFQSTPTVFLKTLMGLRRKGMRFAPTHMGKLLDGRVLSENDFDETDI